MLEANLLPLSELLVPSLHTILHIELIELVARTATRFRVLILYVALGGLHAVLLEEI